jgi:hypothetical protein
LKLNTSTDFFNDSRSVGTQWQAKCGEGATAGTHLAEKWHQTVTLAITHYAPKDTFNMDETTMFFNANKRGKCLYRAKSVMEGKVYLQ